MSPRPAEDHGVCRPLRGAQREASQLWPGSCLGPAGARAQQPWWGLWIRGGSVDSLLSTPPMPLCGTPEVPPGAALSPRLLMEAGDTVAGAGALWPGHQLWASMA